MTKNLVELNEDSFDKFVSKGISVVDFWAVWCGPCKIMAPIFEEASAEMKGKFNFGKVDVDKHGDLAQQFEVMSIPTMIFFKNGEIVDKVVGVLEKDELVERLENL